MTPNGSARREELAATIGDTIANKLPSDLAENYPGQPWRRIIGMRVRMAHIDTENDTTIMWNTLTADMPRLRDYVGTILAGRR